MRNKIGITCMAMGAVLVLAALSLFLWNQWENNAAGVSAKKILPQVMEQMKTLDAADTAGDASVYPDPYDPTMTETEIDGYAYVGYLSVPAIELELPVMSQWDYDRLKIAPCRYAGSTKTGDLVLCAHNYIQHFGSIRGLASGDTVYFTDMDGIVWGYEVMAVEILNPTDVEEMTAGDYALTLFTCTYGGGSHVAVRCQRLTEE